MRRATTGIVLVVLALLGQACAAADEQDTSGPTVADGRFGGVFVVDELRVRGEERELVETIELDIDSEFGALSIATPCGILLGSFSLLDDGRAGVTISGGSQGECSAAADEQRHDLLAVLGRVSSWSQASSGFSLRSPESDSLTLSRLTAG